jgi:hypothetical protein
LFAFGLKAHFDFTVTRRDTTPLFAVEFDGPLHKSSKDQIQRDKKKDTIANKTNFPILHINSRYIDKSYRGLDLLPILLIYGSFLEFLKKLKTMVLFHMMNLLTLVS